MDSNAPKISFIPKSPLARQETFMERKRPRSVMGILAIFFFVAVVGAYGGLYVYEKSLLKQTEEQTADIEKAKHELTASPAITEAKLFRVRADLAQKLLDRHIVIAPIFDFLQKNTLTSIVYTAFSLKQNGDAWEVSLSGESPSYGSLAYQADVLRQKSSDITGFSIKNVTLTKFGTVTFDLTIDFAQSVLSYTKSVAVVPETPAIIPTAPVFAPTPKLTPTPTPTPAPAASTSTPVSRGMSAATSTPVATTESTTTSVAPGWSVAPVSPQGATEQAPASTPATPAPRSFWSWFKFW